MCKPLRTSHILVVSLPREATRFFAVCGYALDNIFLVITNVVMHSKHLPAPISARKALPRLSSIPPRIHGPFCWPRPLVVFIDAQGEVSFMELWLSSLQQGLIRSNFVSPRSGRRYLFAEKSLGLFGLSSPIRRKAMRVRYDDEARKTSYVQRRKCSKCSKTRVLCLS